MHSAAVLLLFGCLAAATAGSIGQLTQDDSSTAVVTQLGSGAMICYTDTAEFFTQAIAVPNTNSYGESLSCFSYTCTAEGTSSGKCQTPLSHGWESTSACKARSNNPAFSDVKCCSENACNPPTDIKLWNYVGPADNTAHLSCYFNALPGLDPTEAYSVVYGPWSGAPNTPREAACLRYQQRNPKTGAALDSWTYSAVDLAACDLKTGKPLGNTYDNVAVASTVMCCAEPDCNAPSPKLDTLAKAGPTMTQALLQQNPSFDISTIKRVYTATPPADGEVVPLPRILQQPTNVNGGVVYMPTAAASGVDASEQANSLLEYQLLQSGVMPMAADSYGPGSYGGYGGDGTYGGVNTGGLSTPVSPAADNSAGTLEDGMLLFTTLLPAIVADGGGASGTTVAGPGSIASTKISGAGVVCSSLNAVALAAAVAAALAMS